MSAEKTVAEQYSHGGLLAAIRTAVSRLGKTVDSVTIEDLAAVDEFHIGGRRATEEFLGHFNFTEKDHVLDVGCGLGGASRFVASKYNTRVTGIDLTEEYIETGKALCAWVRLEKNITLQQGSALTMPFQNDTFDGGYMMHVGMNIEDKALLFNEVYQVLCPGSFFGVYDVMRHRDGDLAYPVPWANEGSTCNLATPDKYRKSLEDAGFEVLKEINRRDFALEFFKRLRAQTRESGSPPPLGLHTLMQESTAVKISNMIENIEADYIAPVEIIVRKI